jgi:hypothetical protein
MRIQVLPDDIRWGHKSDGGLCPVARAIRRETPAGTVEVGHYKVRLWDGHPSPLDSIPPDKVLDLPFVVTWMITRYDITGEMDPFGFEL